MILSHILRFCKIMFEVDFQKFFKKAVFFVEDINSDCLIEY